MYCVIIVIQVLRETLQISGTNVKLVHDSSDTPGYQSVLFIALTMDSVPETLVLVRLRIIVEGVIFEKDFEADVRLQYRFAWDRRNAYNQKVYGVATASGLLSFLFVIRSSRLFYVKIKTILRLPRLVESSFQCLLHFKFLI